MKNLKDIDLSVPCSTDRPGQPTTMSENLNTITTTTLINKSKLIFGIFGFSFSSNLAVNDFQAL
jgi:hypothetical protein